MASMDAVVAEGGAVVVPSPTPPPPAAAPAPARNRGRLALAVVTDAVMCLCIADIFTHVAAVNARDFGRVAFGKECLLVSAAARVATAAGEFTLVALCGVIVAFFSRMADSDSEEGVQWMSVARKIEAAGREVMPTPMLWVMVTGGFFFLAIAAIGDLLKSRSQVKGSAMEHTGSVFIVVGFLGLDALCFVSIPIVAVRLWRVTRPGWRCNDGAEIENP